MTKVLYQAKIKWLMDFIVHHTTQFESDNYAQVTIFYSKMSEKLTKSTYLA